MARHGLHENLVRYMTKLVDGLNKCNEVHTERLLYCLKQLEKTWKNIQDLGLKDLLNSCQTSEEINSRLKSSLIELIRTEKAMFSLLYLGSMQRRMASHQDTQVKLILNVREFARSKLSHFGTFLSVRGQRNITMTAYHNDLPGLVHFIYINRTSDLVIAPTINVEADPTTHCASMYCIIKQKVWDMWQYSELMLTHGYTSLALRDGDFTFSYFLWFEDSMGHPLTVIRPIKDAYQEKPTGILSSKFYKQLTRYLFPYLHVGTVQCYELLCMHVGITSNQFIVASCKKLAGLLYGTSGEASSPISLL